MIYNEESKMHECALCDYTREWRGNLQFHVLAQHYQVVVGRLKLEENYSFSQPGVSVSLSHC